MTKEEIDPKLWRKKKLIGIVLAIFFGPWTYIYTLRRDAARAAIGLGLNLSVSILTFSILYPATKNIPPGHGEGIIYPAIFPIILVFFTWIIVLTDTAVAKEWVITEFKNKSKGTGLILSIFLGPWTWLYTYSKDWWKFWLSIFAGYGFVLAYCFTNNGTFMLLWILSILIIWIISIVSSARRNQSWYESLR
jgi:hypothetical protein